MRVVELLPALHLGIELKVQGLTICIELTKGTRVGCLSNPSISQIQASQNNLYPLLIGHLVEKIDLHF